MNQKAALTFPHDKEDREMSEESQKPSINRNQNRKPCHRRIKPHHLTDKLLQLIL